MQAALGFILALPWACSCVTWRVSLPYLDFGLFVCKTEAGRQLSHHHYSNWKKIIPGLYALEVLPLEDVCVYETYLAF